MMCPFPFLSRKTIQWVWSLPNATPVDGMLDTELLSEGGVEERQASVEERQANVEIEEGFRIKEKFSIEY